jgi:hypothetical protein
MGAVSGGVSRGFAKKVREDRSSLSREIVSPAYNAVNDFILLRSAKSGGLDLMLPTGAYTKNTRPLTKAGIDIDVFMGSWKGENGDQTFPFL